jgi:hypothetical protein
MSASGGRSRVKLSSLMLASAMIVGIAQSAHAVPVFQDDFNSYTGGLAIVNTFGPWTVSQGSIDLIPESGNYNFYPGNGTYVDLNGTTNQYGGIATVQSFAAGDYTLTFNLGGSVGGGGNVDPTTKTTVVSLGDWSTIIPLAPGAGFTTQSFSFHTTGGTLNFVSQAGGNANVGNILDNVALTDPPATPLPSTWTMLIGGFMGLGFVSYLGARRQKKNAACPPAFAAA